MTLRTKLQLSALLQVFFFLVVPQAVSSSGLLGSNWIRVWEDIKQHRIFLDRSPNKAVLLGDSDFGERFCHMHPDAPGSAVDDNCTLRAVLNFTKPAYPYMKNFEFYDFSKNGTIAETHLFYLLQLMDLPPNSVKYVIYAAADKFFFELNDRSYYVLNEQTAEKIESLPPELKSEKLEFVARKYRERIEEYSKRELFYHLRYRLRRAKTYFWNQRAFFQDLISAARGALNPHAEEIGFNEYLRLHLADGGKVKVDQFQGELSPPPEFTYFTKPDDFLFLDIIKELCDRRGIRLVFFFPPDRIGCPRDHLEPCDSKIFRPVMDHFKGSNVHFIDMRKSEFIVPRDTLDGIHPSMSMKLKMAKEFLDELEKLEAR